MSTEPKKKRPTLPPLQVTEELKNELEKEASECKPSMLLSPYLVSIIHNRHHKGTNPKPAPANPTDAQSKARIEALEAGMKKALKLLDSYGERPKDLYNLLTNQ